MWDRVFLGALKIFCPQDIYERKWKKQDGRGHISGACCQNVVFLFREKAKNANCLYLISMMKQ
jgi:hypothetical protein